MFGSKKEPLAFSNVSDFQDSPEKSLTDTLTDSQFSRGSRVYELVKLASKTYLKLAQSCNPTTVENTHYSAFMARAAFHQKLISLVSTNEDGPLIYDAEFWHEIDLQSIEHAKDVLERGVSGMRELMTTLVITNYGNE